MRRLEHGQRPQGVGAPLGLKLVDAQRHDCQKRPHHPPRVIRKPRVRPQTIGQFLCRHPPDQLAHGLRDTRQQPRRVPPQRRKRPQRIRQRLRSEQLEPIHLLRLDGVLCPLRLVPLLVAAATAVRGRTRRLLRERERLVLRSIATAIVPLPVPVPLRPLAPGGISVVASAALLPLPLAAAVLPTHLDQHAPAQLLLQTLQQLRVNNTPARVRNQHVANLLPPELIVRPLLPLDPLCTQLPLCPRLFLILFILPLTLLSLPLQHPRRLLPRLQRFQRLDARRRLLPHPQPLHDLIRRDIEQLARIHPQHRIRPQRVRQRLTLKRIQPRRRALAHRRDKPPVHVPQRRTRPYHITQRLRHALVYPITRRIEHPIHQLWHLHLQRRQAPHHVTNLLRLELAHVNLHQPTTQSEHDPGVLLVP